MNTLDGTPLMENARRDNTERLFETWTPYLSKVMEHRPNLSELAAYNLAQVLENTRSLFSGANRGRVNETTQVGDVNQDRHFYYDVIASVFPNMVAQQFVSVQPMTSRIGVISFLDYSYGSNKGSINRGEIMQNPRTGHRIGTGATNYTGEIIDNEEVGNTGGTAYTGSLSYLPVRPGSVIFTIGAIRLIDNGSGVLVNGNSTGTPLTSAAATVSYDNGQFALTLSASATDNVYVTYEYNNEHSPSQVPEMNIHIDNRSITARSRKLKALYALDGAYDVQTQFGLDMDELILKAASSEIMYELDSEIFNDLLLGASGTSTWYSKPPQAVSMLDHKTTFVDELISASNSIYSATQRYGGNFVVAGVGACSVLESLGAPRFVSTGVTGNGPHICGVLDGKWQIIKNPYYNIDTYLVGYKGESPIDAGYVWAPYRPLFSTQLIQTADFTAQRGFSSMNGKAMINPGAYVRGTIIHTQAP